MPDYRPHHIHLMSHDAMAAGAFYEKMFGAELIASKGANGLPGRSFAPLLAGQAGGERKSVFVFDEYGPVRMIRSQEWKLVWRYPAGAHELYDVANDPNERVNLFIQPGYADRIRTLRRELDDWFSIYVDPELDGSRLPVTGYGQRDHATKADAFDYRPRN